MRGKDPIETIMDLLLEDRSRIGTIYFLMNEDNIKKQIKQPWVSFGSDAASIEAEGVFLKSAAHPRAYGNFARLLGKYVRDEKAISQLRPFAGSVDYRRPILAWTIEVFSSQACLPM